MKTRYDDMFLRLAAEDRCAFVPFVQLGDPHIEQDVSREDALQLSFDIISQLIDAGADALELGIPFSDPVADGPTIQEAGQRALRAGVTPTDALDLVARVRREFPDVPVGLLVYANLVVGPGEENFYRQAGEAGVDSVLVADVPISEGAAFSAVARRFGVAPVHIATPECTDAELRELARLSGGYTYVVTRNGVTGAGVEAGSSDGLVALCERLNALGAPPPVFGFGISKPEHVVEARRAGARGAISGSAIVRTLLDGGVGAGVALTRMLSAACASR